MDFSVVESKPWIILSELERSIKTKIESVGIPLKDWDIQINYGIKTGLNDAFIINTEQRETILSNCLSESEKLRTEEIIRPILRGRDIKRYGYDWSNLWLINTHNGIKGVKDRIHIEDYPSVKSHLDKFWKKLSSRSDKGETPYNLRNCAYIDDFNKPKIIYIEIMTDNPKEGFPFPCFSYDNIGAIVLNTGYIMVSDSHDIRYILGVINSKLGRHLLKFYVSQLGERQFRMLHQFIIKVPIPKVDPSFENEMAQIVDRAIHGENVDDLINQKVYQLYNLNLEEIKYIENE